MLLVLGTLFDPGTNEVFLPFAEGFVKLRRRHDLFRVDGKDVFENRAFLRFPRDDGALFRVFQLGISAFGRVETEVCLALLRIESVAGETRVREDRPDMGIEGDLFRQGLGRRFARGALKSGSGTAPVATGVQ